MTAITVPKKSKQFQLPPLRPRPEGVTIRLSNGVIIPDWVRTVEAFRRWAKSDEFPQTGRFAFLGNILWLDVEMEQLYLHNQLKYEIGLTFGAFVRASSLGRYIPDGMLLSHPAAGLSTIPDGILVTYEALRTGRIREISSQNNGCVELEGTPDIVIEVVSLSSEAKDLEELPSLYWWANIPEYWVFDARTEEVNFELLKRGPDGYTKTKHQADGWLTSDVLKKDFRLVQGKDPLENPLYTLEVK